MAFFFRATAEEEHKAATLPADQPTAKAGGITYDPELVGRLKQEHQELVRIFSSIKAAAAECQFQQLPGLLTEFKHAFLNHVGTENVKIYVYLQQHGQTDADTQNFISGVRKEANEIARAVMKFVDTHIATAPAPVSVMMFNAELEKMGAALTKRMGMEENRLYALYRP